MNRVQTYTLNEEIASADLNDIQDRALGIAQMVGFPMGRRYLRATTTQITVGKFAFFASGTEDVRTGTPAVHSIGTLSAAGWWYVYVYDNAGTLTTELSQTAPDASLCYKGGGSPDPTRAYAGCVFAETTTALIPLIMHSGHYVWRGSGTSLNAELGTVSNTTTFTNVDLTSGFGAAKCLPPHSEMLEVAVEVTESGGTLRYLYVATESDTDVEEIYNMPPNATHTLGTYTFDVGTTQVLKAKFSNATGVSATFFRHGFWE